MTRLPERLLDEIMHSMLMRLGSWFMVLDLLSIVGLAIFVTSLWLLDLSDDVTDIRESSVIFVTISMTENVIVLRPPTFLVIRRSSWLTILNVVDDAVIVDDNDEDKANNV